MTGTAGSRVTWLSDGALLEAENVRVSRIGPRAPDSSAVELWADGLEERPRVGEVLREGVGELPREVTAELTTELGRDWCTPPKKPASMARMPKRSPSSFSRIVRFSSSEAVTLGGLRPSSTSCCLMCFRSLAVLADVDQRIRVGYLFRSMITLITPRSSVRVRSAPNTRLDRQFMP
jgi:hypothetical protein